MTGVFLNLYSFFQKTLSEPSDDQELRTKSERNLNLTFEKVSFQYKRNELRSFLRDMQIILLAIAFCRNVLVPDYAEQKLKLNDLFLLLYVAIIQVTKRFDFKTTRQLSIFAIGFSNLISLVTFNHAANVTGVKESYYLYEAIVPLITLQGYMMKLMNFPCIFCALNQACLWLFYIYKVANAIGLENIPFNILNCILCQLLFFAKSINFKVSLEKELSNAFKNLRETQKNLNNILDMLPEGILIFDKDYTKIEFANNVVYKMIFPESSQSLQHSALKAEYSQTGEDISSEKSSYQSFNEKDLFEQIQNTTISNVEYLQEQKIEKMNLLDLISQLPTKEGFVQAKFKKPIKILADFYSLWINSRQSKLVIVKDNSAIRQREKAIISSHLQTVFFSQIAHDLRTPLNSILASNTSLLGQSGHTQKTKRVLEVQKNSIQYLINLIEDIMDMSRLEFNKFSLNETWFSMNDLIKEVFQIAEFQAELKNVQLISEVYIEPTDIIHSDKKRLKQVILNLVSNALKFTQRGSVTVRCRIVSPTQVSQNFGNHLINQGLFDLDQENQQILQVDVIDTGVGMTIQEQQQLFQMFGMLKSSQQMNQQGVGLGLMICKKICEFMGGKISVTSEPGRGSTFSFTVALNNDSDNRSPSRLGNEETDFNEDVFDIGNHQYLKKYSFKNAQVNLSDEYFSRNVSENQCSCHRILIVDDNNFNIMAMNLVLEEIFNSLQLPFQEIDKAVDGQEGIEAMEAKLSRCCKLPYKLVFIDQNMPRMDGIQMMKTIKKMMSQELRLLEYIDTAFALCTADTTNEMYQDQYKALGFKYFIEKPIDMDKLKKIIQDELI